MGCDSNYEVGGYGMEWVRVVIKLQYSNYIVLEVPYETCG